MGDLSRAFALVAASVGLALFGVGARAQDSGVADFYRGKTVSLIVSTTAGSSYDLMSRAIARFIGKYIPGSPGVVVRNQPGAGGITALNSLYHVAPRDGLTLAGVQGSVPFEPMLGTKEADFDAARLNWLGSPSSETCVTTVWAASGVNSIKDARTREVTVGSSGANANPSFYARLINAVLGVKLRLVFGYPGQPDVFIAMEKGEVDGHSCVFWSALSSTRPDWLRDGKVRLLLQYGPKREPALGDTPFLADLVTNPEDRILVAAARPRATLCHATGNPARARRGHAQGVGGGFQRRGISRGDETSRAGCQCATNGRGHARVDRPDIRHARAHSQAPARVVDPMR